MHAEAFKFVRRALSELDQTGWAVLEIGSRDVNGTVRGLFNGRSYLGMDVAPGPGAELVADAATWDPEVARVAGYQGPRMFHAIVCCEVLEHADTAEAIVRNACRLLHPLGVFLMTCAGPGRAPHSAVDGGQLRPGEFYRNVTPDEFRAWASGFTGVFVDTLGPDLRALCVR